MTDFVFITLLVIYFAAFGTALAHSIKKAQHKTMSSDGHVVPKSQDLTCEAKYDHHHVPDENGKRYIVHEEPEDGWVVLNGVKRRIKDCKDL